MAMERNAIIITIRNPEEKRVKKEKKETLSWDLIIIMMMKQTFIYYFNIKCKYVRNERGGFFVIYEDTWKIICLIVIIIND